MPKYKITIAYDGTHYHGWQLQPSRSTIQGALEEVLFGISGKEIRVFGAGRTDAGVHALGQVAHFESQMSLSSDIWKKAFNQALPPDIRVLCVHKVKENFHARYRAKSKTYRYTISVAQDPCVLNRHRMLYVGYPINIARMRRAAKYLIGKKDFSSFGANPRRKDGMQDHPVKDLKRIQIAKKNSCLLIDLEASGFLYKMARRIVGTLLDVGRGKTPVSQMTKMIAAKNPSHAGPTVSPHGLCLMEIKYL